MLTIAVASLIAVAHLLDASVSGTVRDASSGAPLMGAIVAVSGATREIATAADGRFVAAPVRDGMQRMTVRCIGHATRTIELLVPVHGDISIDIALDPVAVRLAPVSIMEKRAAVHADPSRADPSSYRVVTPDVLRKHPFLAEPDVLRAVSGGDVFMRPETAGGLFVRGGRADQIAFSLDGIPVFNVAHLGGLLGAWNTDALSEAHLSVDATGAGGATALSGALNATTLTATDRVTVRTAISSTQLRLTAAGPLAATNTRYLISLRQAVPTLGADVDPNLLRGESGDLLGTLSTPFARGTFALLAYTSGDDFTASRVVSPVNRIAPRNAFAWGSRSLGATWVRAYANAEVHAAAWQAATNSTAEWNSEGSDVTLHSRRTDYGMQIVRRPTTNPNAITLGARVELIHTLYRSAGTDSTGMIGAHRDATLPIVTLTASRAHRIGQRVRANIGGALSMHQSALLLAPHARIDWSPTSRVFMSAAASRSLQYVQSLHNSESVVSQTFPAELPVMASRGQVPVARGDQVSLTAALHPLRGVALSAVAYAREMRGVLMVAEEGAAPFAVRSADGTPFAVGRSTAAGASADVRYTSNRITALLMYSAQRVRYRAERVAYTPEFAAPQRVDVGVTIEASRGLAFRIGGMAAFGRRATVARGAVEWDGCNLADRACEFAGTPASSPDALGALSLPAYGRTDIGARKAWHMVVRNRDQLITVYGTVTNLFNRTNFLTRFERDGVLNGVEMRSRAPLVVGMEWGY
jgi:Carboxypeptidase regulatory-like domain